MKQNINRSHIPTLAVLLVGAVFALCMMLVLLTGAEGYAALVRRGEEGCRQRTAAQYVSTRVRQAPSGSSIQVGVFHGIPTLEVRETLDGESCITRVYCHDGYLRELFTPEGGSFSPEDGEKLLPLSDLVLQISGDRLEAALYWEDGRQQALTLYLPGREVLP